MSSETPTIPGLFDTPDGILEGLNDEQHAAVTHGEGPLLIVAGAGTGKTQVITRRIAWLITTKRARPDEILALTFTEKAAAEMEARVDELVPYGYVGATISTFHAFCDGLLRQHAVELGLTSQLRVDTPAEILVFLREHLFELGLERYAPLGRPETHLRALLSVFDRARDEDVTPEQYLHFAKTLADEAGDDEELAERAAAELEKARAYEVFQRLLQEHGRIDFGSQIAFALKLLRERSYLRREYQDRFRYILVDEFQDTNHVQFELVKLLAGTRRNVTVVGDDDQSIYRFRGAKVENIMDFPKAFEGTEVKLLRRNYRSGQEVLDTAHRLIQFNNPHRLEDELGYDKRLVADRDIDAEVEHVHVRTASDEADHVASEIAAAIEEGAAPRDFAVLARTHMGLDPIAQALRVNGVPFRRVGMRGLYTRPEIQLCLNVLRAIADPNDDTAVHQVLADPFFGANTQDIARLGAAARRSNRPVLKLAQQALAEPVPEFESAEITDETRKAFERALGLLQHLTSEAAQRPTKEVLYTFVTESGLLEKLASEQTLGAEERIQNLSKILSIAHRVSPLLRTDRVDQFIRHLDLLIEMGDDPAAAEVEFDENAVHLLTVHNAKGLEFPIVYLVQLVEGRFPGYKRSDALPFPEELRTGEEDSRDAHYREERRLFYVGLTRARDKVVLTHADDYGGMRKSKPSRFVGEALSLVIATEGAKGTSAMQSIGRHAPPAESPPAELEPLPPDAPLRVSHNQVSTYLECPLRYRYAFVLNVPPGPDPGRMYGIAMHHAVRVYHQSRIRGLPVTVDDVLAVFEQAWSSEGFLSREHEDRRFAEGQDVLRRFVEQQESVKQPLAVEREFKFKLGATTVSGRWDRIDERDAGIVLVDYKTADVDGPDDAAKRARDDARDGQLGLYALAYKEMHDVVPAAVELHFVQSEMVGSSRVKPEYLARATERVHQAAEGIRRRVFPARPSGMRCGTCAFARVCPSSVTRGGS